MKDLANPNVDLELLHTTILSDLATVFPPTSIGGKPAWTLAFYGRVDQKIPTPSIYLEMTDMIADEKQAPGGEIGTDQWAVTFKYEAYIFTDYKASGNYRILSRLYAAQLAAFLLNHRWTDVHGVNGCRVNGAHVDRFTPDAGAAQYDCMRVEFEQDGLIGLDSWAGGTPPSKVFVGIAPNIGEANIGDYVELV